MNLLGDAGASDDRSTLEDEDFEPRLGEVCGGDQPVVTAAHDDRVRPDHPGTVSGGSLKRLLHRHAFFRSGSKKGRSTTVAGGRRRPPSTAPSISTPVPVSQLSAPPPARALVFFRWG